MNYKYVTFALDVQLNDNEDWIPKGTKVRVSDNEYHLNRHEGFIPVIITEAMDYDGDRVEFDPYVEWFNEKSFVEFK